MRHFFDVRNFIPTLKQVLKRGNLTAGTDIGISADDHLFQVTIKDLGAVGSTETINWTSGNLQKLELDENCTLTFTDPTGAARLSLIIEQESSGGDNTITWPSNVSWPDGIPPVLTGGTSTFDIVNFLYDDLDDEYYGMMGFDFK